MRRAAELSRAAWLLGFFLALQGCGWFDGPPIDTKRKAVVVASAEVRGAYLLLESLIDSRSIDARNARLIKTNLDKANGAIEVAWAAFKVSDFTKMESALDNMRLALDIGLGILGEYDSG